MKKAIVWHTLDLRTEWNPALSAAAGECEKILPLYIYDEKREELGGASQWWLKETLKDLSAQYKALGGNLCIRVGDTEKIFEELVKKTGAAIIYFNARFERKAFSLQEQIAKKYPCEVFNGNHLVDPREIEVSKGKPYSVFTPFYKACLKEISVPSRPFLPKKLDAIALKSDCLSFEHEKWMKKLDHYWIPTRKEGLKTLKQFVNSGLKKYQTDRNFPAIEGTSKLSPYLHFGQISPHEIFHAANSEELYNRQLFWREFGTYFLFHFPEAKKKNWDQKFDQFTWDQNPTLYKKWTQGLTGYPIVDAAMRQLWETGWIHNRLRMIVASFLTKDLFINWIYGERWFWDTLVDADTANNVLGWQWTAGSGPDAAPYFRIFNPVLQGERFDPDGSFVKEYLPQLKDLPAKWIHHPWDAPEEVLEKAGIQLGKDYPKPIVDHAKARDEAMKRYKHIK